MKKPAQRTPRKAWQWAVKTDEGYVTAPKWTRWAARFEAECRSERIDAHYPRPSVVKVEVRELPPAARQRRGR